MVPRGLSALRAIVLVAVFLVAGAAQAASDLTIADFVGRYRGEAHEEPGDRFFVGVLRDVAVELQREGEGFRLGWSTLIRDDAADAAAGRRPRIREGLLHFVPAAQPGQFRTPDPPEPFADRPAAWAHIDGNALTVRVMTIGADGDWELQTYVRTLTGDRMTLRFTRTRPGSPDLVVVGELTRLRE